MKMRILSVLLAFAILFGMMPAVAFAEDTEPVEATETVETTEPEQSAELVTRSAFYVNPLYADMIDAQVLESAYHQNQVFNSGAGAASENGCYTTPAEAAVILREAMENRATSVVIPYEIPAAYLEYEDGMLDLGMEMFDIAFAHTGVPTQGDYLQWHYQMWGVGATGYWNQDMTAVIADLTFTLSYHTDAAQEAAVTSRVNSLLAELNPTGTDYQKIKTVYDWMCANIDYDYDNLNDPEYYLKYSAYAALINGTSVCQGYANLLYRLALEMGIDCRIITGYSANGSGTPEAHAWNIVKLGDSYYNLDATWDSARTTPVYFLKSQASFENHYRNSDYTTSAFNAAYPMGAEDYDPSQDVVEDDNIIASGTCDEFLTWTLDEEGTLTISGEGQMNTNPAPWNDYCEKIKAVVIEEGVTSIGSYAFFGCSGLTNIVLPDGVTEIQDSAFRKCTSLKNITIPDSVITIGESAFYECASLTSITIPSGVTNIESHTFCKCGNLEKVVLSEGVEKIGQYAFTLCKNLKNVTIPDSVTEIGEYAFFDCSSLEEIAIPESVSTIGNGAFLKCKSLNSIVIPDGVTTIGEGMFEECYALSSITLPDTITSIGDVAFYRCNITDIYIPYGVTSIGNQAFMQCGNLTNISIPNSATSIGDFAFLGCDSLRYVTIPASVTTIGASVFDSCEALWHILYTGTEEKWNTIAIGDANDTLLNTTRHYNATGDEIIAVDRTTCTEKISCECTICGAVLSEEIPGGGHSFSDWTTKEATCTVDGSRSRTCSKCDYTETEVLTAPGHSHVPVVTAPTCTEKGYTTYTCACGDTYVADEVPALNHDLGDWAITDATCTVDGSKTRACSRCDYTETEVIVAPGHSHVPEVTAPTCTEKGYTTYTCACGDSYVADETAALGHNHAYSMTKAPTESVSGSITGICTRCGDEVSVTLPKLNKDDYTYEVELEPTEEAEGIAHYLWKNTDYGVYSFDVVLNKLTAALGDVSGDGEINVLDLMYLANYFAKGETINKENADVNKDGSIDVRDLMFLANVFAGKETLS